MLRLHEGQPAGQRGNPQTDNGNYCVYNQTDGKPLPLKHKKAPTKLSELGK